MANIRRFGLLISIQGMGWAIDYPFHAEILLNIDRQRRYQGGFAVLRRLKGPAAC